MAEIRRLCWRLLLQVPREVQRVLAGSYGRRHHQGQAQRCHYRRQYRQLAELQL